MELIKKEMFKLKRLWNGIWKAMRRPARVIARARFWQVALLDLALRLFVVRPLGALLGIVVGFVWLCHNMDSIVFLLMSLRQRFVTWSNGYDKKSLWLDQKGRAEILRLIDRLSLQGLTFCNLAEEIELPVKSEWYAISKELNELGFLTQFTGDAFYIIRQRKHEAQNIPDAA